MQTHKLLKLGIFLAVVVLCFIVDSGLGIFGASTFLALAAVGGETENVQDPPQESEEEKIKRIAGDSVKQVQEEQKIKLNQIENSINELIQKASVPPGEFIDPANKDSERIKDGRNYLRAIVAGDKSLATGKYKDYLNETTGSAGAFLVPEEWAKTIMTNAADYGVVLRNADIIQMSGKELIIPKNDAKSTFSFVNEAGLKSVSNPTFAQVKLARKDGGFIVLLSQQLLEDEAFDVMGFVNQMAAEIIGTAIDTAGFRGNTDPAIVGLLNKTNGAALYEIGGDSVLDLVYNDIIKAIAKIPSKALRNSKWYLHRSLLAYIKTMRTGTGDSAPYIMDRNDRALNLLESYPLELTDQCYSLDEDAADRVMAVFGDLKEMKVGMRKNLTMSFSKDASLTVGQTTINLWQQGLVGLNFNVSFDIKYMFPSNIALIKTKA